MHKEILDLSLQEILLNSLEKSKTAIIVVDMVKGFVEEGILSSPRVAKMAPNLIDLNNRMRGYDKVYFIDSHKESSIEFKSYPVHCVENTSEEELIDGLSETISREENLTLIKKNSTNGFHAPDFEQWLNGFKDKIENYIVVGCVTDICVMQFALTLKTYFNQNNLGKRVIIPANCVETFDIPGHDAEEMNYFALYTMLSNGIEVVSEIK